MQIEENSPYSWGTDLDYDAISEDGTGGFWISSFYDFSGLVISEYVKERINS